MPAFEHAANNLRPPGVLPHNQYEIIEWRGQPVVVLSVL